MSYFNSETPSKREAFSGSCSYMQCGESEVKGYLGRVTNWCQGVYQFKNKVDFYNYLSRIELIVSRKNTHRLTLENIVS